jgi:hypothetical protein
MPARQLREVLVEPGACSEATTWAAGRDVGPEAWQDCQRAEWAIWLAEHLGVARPTVIEAACRCARLALKFVPTGEDRPLAAVEAAEAWTRGERDHDRLRRVDYAADDFIATAAIGSAKAAGRVAFCANATMFGLHSVADFAARAGVTQADLADAVRFVVPYEAVEVALAKWEASHR